MIVPKKTPEPVRAIIEHSVVEVMSRPDVTELLKKVGIVPASEGSKDLLKRVKAESATWNDVLVKANIKLE